MAIGALLSSAGSDLLKSGQDSLVKGVLGGLGSQFERFKKGGFSCLGKQAFNENDLNTAYGLFQTKLSQVNKNDAQSVSGFLSYCNLEIHLSNYDIMAYKSACSKHNREAYRDTVVGVLHDLLKNTSFEFDIYPDSAVNHRGETVHFQRYAVKQNGGISDTSRVKTTDETADFGKLESYDSEKYFDQNQGLMNAYNELGDNEKELLTSFASENNLGIEQVLNHIVNGDVKLVKGKPTWNIGASGTNSDGSTWGVGVSKTNNQNTADGMVKLIFLGCGAYVLFRFMFRK